MRIALIALSVKGGGGQHTEALACPLSESTDLHLFVPQHYKESFGQATLHTFQTGTTRPQAAKNLLNPSRAHEIWSEIQELAPDIIHIITGFTFPWCHIWAKKAQEEGIPLVVTHHNPEAHPAYFPNSLIEPTLNFFAKRMLRQYAVHVHVHVDSFVPLIEQIGVPKERIHTLRLGSPAKRFEAYASPSPPPRENVVFYFGRIEYYKGIDLLIEAAKRFRGEYRFLIAGKGTLPRKLLHRMEKDTELFDLKLGFMPDSEVAHWLERCTVAVAPYRQVTQSFYPFIVSAFNAPFIATDLGSFSEDTPLIGGTLIQPDSVDEIERGIRAAVDQPTRHPDNCRFEDQIPDYLAMYDRMIQTRETSK